MHEHSFGIIPLRRSACGWEVLLVRHKAGHWAFPKGHPAAGESAKETALRELYEETQLEVTRFLAYEPLQEDYTFERQGKRISKQVTYFLAEVAGEVVVQSEEIAEYRWVAPEDAQKLATFPEAQHLCGRIPPTLENNSSNSGKVD